MQRYAKYPNLQAEAIPEPTPAVEPLVVEGTFDSTNFTPSAGQPTFAQAYAAFSSGTPVLIKFDDMGVVYEGNIIGYVKDEGGDGIYLSAYIGERDIRWASE